MIRLQRPEPPWLSKNGLKVGGIANRTQTFLNTLKYFFRLLRGPSKVWGKFAMGSHGFQFCVGHRLADSDVPLVEHLVDLGQILYPGH